ncbi:MAG: zinc-dependent metalloprotease [Bacteroidota bacterium]|nr:zinc-dependent metalloprotease [Bacteroidota bacterium]
MKTKYNILILLGCLMFYSGSIDAQTNNCGSYYFESEMNILDANYVVRKQANETMLLDSISIIHPDSFFARTADASYTILKIPIVVHLIGNDVVSNISPFAVQQKITELTDLFRNTSNNSLGVDMQIEFCLATKDPSGNASTGINVINGSYGPYAKTDDATFKALSNWNASKYLNLWICNISSTENKKAWGSEPALYLNSTTNKYRDGVVCDYNNFSTKLLAHEIGHWMNLRHTFGDDGSDCDDSSNDDFCKDTPWCSGSAVNITSCDPILTEDQCLAKNILDGVSNHRQIENHMDDSPESCRTIFTLQQKVRLRLTLTNLRSGILNSNAICPAACNDQIQNGDETGIDCGGSCPQCIGTTWCNVLQFKINGQSINTGKIINVCNSGNITISPFYYPNTCTAYYWDVVTITRNTSQGLPYAYACAYRPLHNDYKCKYDRLFISIQECDENKNLISNTEHADWVDVPQDFGQSFNLYSYLPQIGGSIVDGKYYKIKIAGEYFRNYSGYIKVFKSIVTISNKTITDNQYADDLSLNNVNVNSNIKVVAKNGIEILSNSALTSGSYYIGSFDCNTIGGFRLTNNSQKAAKNNEINSISIFPDISVNGSGLQKKVDAISIIPNPNNGNFTIINDEREGVLKSIEIQNAIGVTMQIIENPSMTTEVSIQNQSSGLYLVKLNYTDKVITKKIIKQ